jgi:hypothetical protein
MKNGLTLPPIVTKGTTGNSGGFTVNPGFNWGTYAIADWQGAGEAIITNDGETYKFQSCRHLRRVYTDTYDFDKNNRSTLLEILTTAGRVFSGTDYEIDITGEHKIRLTGTGFQPDLH